MPLDVPPFTFEINGHDYDHLTYIEDPSAFLIRLAQDVVAVVGAVVGPALATALVAGVVRWDDVTITGDEDAVLSAILATVGSAGIVEPDDDTIGIIGGVIFAKMAVVGSPGIVELDNDTLHFDGDGKAAVSDLLAAEPATRAAADTALQGSITAEAAARDAADSALATDISDEATARASADTTLQTNIDTEETARVDADLILGRLSTLLAPGLSQMPLMNLPATSGLMVDVLEAEIDADGNVRSIVGRDGIRRVLYPYDTEIDLPQQASDHGVPVFGIVDQHGQFMGFLRNGQLVADISSVWAKTGRVLRQAQLPDLADATIDEDGKLLFGRVRGGAAYDPDAGRRVRAHIEHIEANGTVVETPTGTSRQCVVAYKSGVGRVVLTPYSDYHWMLPKPGYGDKSVLAWRWLDGEARSTAEQFCLSVDYPGAMIPEDDDAIFLFSSDGQSLNEGSHANDDYFWTDTAWPDRTLVLDNTTIPRDVRLGRDADDSAFVLDPETLGGFAPILPQTGNPANLGFTPIEATAMAIQEKNLRRFGKVLRICVMALGVSGTAIEDLDAGSANRTNFQTAIDAFVAAAEAEGWRPVCAIHEYIQGESDVTDTVAAYKALLEAYVADIRAICLAATGTQPKVLVWSWSSFAEAADDESTLLGGNLGQLEAWLDDQDNIKMVGPHYPLQAYYNPDNAGVPDWVHWKARGSFYLGEMACDTAHYEVWGVSGPRPLYVLSSVYDDNGGAGPFTVTNTWSQPIKLDATLVPTRANDGLEVSYGSGVFKAITSHDFDDGDTVSVITLESGLTAPQLATAQLNVGLAGQTTPRAGDQVPGTNIRVDDDPYDRSEYDGFAFHRFALHQRIPLT